MESEYNKATVQCAVCAKMMEVKRSPRKGYKQTSRGCLCDECYPKYMTAKVLQYGCSAEFYGGFEGTESAIGMMKLANRLWNALVEIDRYEREQYRRLTSEPAISAQIEAAEKHRDALCSILRKQNEQQRKKGANVDPETATELKRVRAELKMLYALNKAAVAGLRIANFAALENLKADVAAKIKAVTDEKKCGLPWTMRNPLLDRFKIAVLRSKKKGAQLRFHRFDGTGTITVPFTNGLSIAAAHEWKDDSGKFQIQSFLMSGHPREKRTLCRIGIGTDESKRPIWLTAPVVFHRPIPDDAEIRGVMVCREIVGGVPRWKLCITVRSAVADASNQKAACGIDIGYRKRPGGLRVAYWADTYGDHGEFLLPSKFETLNRKLDDLRSIMDSHFNDVRDKLTAYLTKFGVSLPMELQEAFSNTHRWKSPARLVHAMRIWKDHRITGDDEIWNACQYWYYGRKQKPDPVWNGHRHLWLWHSNLSDQLFRERREVYRVWSSAMSRKYGAIYIEEFDLRKITETAEADEDTEYASLVRYHRKIAALSVLRQSLTNACSANGVTLTKVDAKYTTHTCPNCQDVIQFDAAAQLVCVCQNCNMVWDQDHVGAKNVLERGLHANGANRAVAK